MESYGSVCTAFTISTCAFCALQPVLTQEKKCSSGLQSVTHSYPLTLALSLPAAFGVACALQDFHVAISEAAAAVSKENWTRMLTIVAPSSTIAYNCSTAVPCGSGFMQICRMWGNRLDMTALVLTLRPPLLPPREAWPGQPGYSMASTVVSSSLRRIMEK